MFKHQAYNSALLVSEMCQQAWKTTAIEDNQPSCTADATHASISAV
jgi:hypothetical protein